MKMTQEEYDFLLIDAFFRAPDAPMWRICFGAEENPDLKRLHHRYFKYTAVSVYICERMPKLAEMLWKYGQENTVKLARVLSQSQIEPKELTDEELDKRRVAFNAMKKQEFVTDQCTPQIKANSKFVGKHGWHVCS